jgi:hypothetical protein
VRSFIDTVGVVRVVRILRHDVAGKQVYAPRERELEEPV